ncbi:hypothetical protein [Calditerrivibrio sp.]|uniref:tetratricopeptide repeat protein n=1 Tax=Calditerrivibrio sp. TaxID=2792612 RepID=UPI003D09C9A7
MKKTLLLSILSAIFIVSLVNSSYAANPLDALKSITDTAVGLFKKDNVPKTVAVLPFTGEGTDEDKKELRITFNNHISSKKFENIKLDEVDEKIAIIEKETGKKWSDLDNITLANKLGVDGLFYVEVLGIEKVYAGLYGSLSIKVKARLVSSEKGEIVWEKEDSVAERSGGVPLSPWGAISTAISSALVLRDTVKISLMDKLFREMAKTIPEPKVSVVRKPPVIFSVITNAKDSPFKLGAEILVAVKGEPGCLAKFEIPDIAKDIPLTEIEPGNYVGKYIVNEGDNGKNKLMKVVLFSPKTKLESIYPVFSPIELDSIPPKEVSSLVAEGLKDKVRLSWEKMDDVKDYFIQRSESGDFVDIGITQVNEYFDDKAVIGKTYYYRVFARDTAGNLSKPSEIKFYYVKKGPTEISGSIVENSIFYKDASPYIVRGNLFISKGIELTIESGVLIVFDNNTELKINGSVRLNGNKKDPITIKGSNYRLIVSDAGDNALIGNNFVIEGGGEFVVSNSGVSLSEVEISNFENGLVVERNGIVHGENVSIKNCKTGLVIKEGTIKGKYIFANNDIAVNYISGKIAEKGFIFHENKFYLESKSRLVLDEVQIEDPLAKNLFDFLTSINSNVDIVKITPLNLSLKEIKLNTIEDIKAEIIKALEKADQEEIKKNLGKLESIAKGEDIKSYEFLAYLYSKYISYEKSIPYIEKSELKFKEILNDYIKKGKNSNFLINVTDIKVPSLQESEQQDLLLVKRLQVKALRDFLDVFLSSDSYDKQMLKEIDNKIVVNASKYIPAVYQILRKSNDVSSSIYFIYALDRQSVIDDLKTFGIIGKENKETKIALVSCNFNNVTDEIRKLIKKHKFEFVELKHDICDISYYYPKAKENLADLLIMFKSDTKQLPSKLGNNLILFSSNIEIKLVDVFLEKDYSTFSEGGSSFHINEEEGKKDSLKDAFSKLSNKFERALLSFERDIYSDEHRIKAKAKYLSEKTEEPIVVSILKAYNVFVNQYKSYADNPVLEISIKNNTGKQISNLKYSIFVKGFMDFPTEDNIDNIDSGKIAVAKVRAVFNNKLLELTENTKIQAEIKLKYVVDGSLNETKTTAVLNLFEKNALVWDDKRKLSTFITPRDPNILDISRIIINNIPKKGINNNISVGLGVFEFLKTYGIKYQQDPNSPYSTISGNAETVDYVQYPTDTLKRKTGDCDDLVALLSSLFESLGIKTAFIDIPGHIFLMFDSGINASEIVNYGMKKEDFIDYNGRLYIPLETTLINANFLDSWKQGLNLYRSNYNKGLNIIFTDKGWEIYKPPTFEQEKLNVSLPYNFASNFISSYIEIIKLRDSILLQNIKNSEYRPENTLYRLFLNSLLDDALHIVNLLVNAGYKSPQFFNDAGNILFYNKKYSEAVDYYKKAYEMSGSHLYIYNIITTYEKMMDKKNADIWRKKISEITK